jgi:hypothetical protein
MANFGHSTAKAAKGAKKQGDEIRQKNFSRKKAQNAQRI